MKKHNTVKVVLITILVFLLLSWILPAAYYSGQYVDQGRVQMGLYELFNYPLTALSYFGYIALFILFIGGFYGILYKIPAYRTFLDKIVSIFEGKEKIFLAIVSVLLAVGVSICGLQIAFAIFIPFIVALILLMGYDKIVAAMIIIGSMAAGLIGSTYAYANMNVITSVLSLNLDYQIGVRFVILIVGIVLVLFNTFVYIKKYMKITKPLLKVNKEVKIEVDVEKKPSTNSAAKKTNSKTVAKKNTKVSKTAKATKSAKGKSTKNANKAALKDNNIIVVKESITDNNDDYLIPEKEGSSHKVWPFVVGFTLMFILLIIAFITWGDNGFKISLFDNITKSVTEFKIFKFPIFSKLYGTMNAFGTWTLVDLFLPIALLTLILVIIYKVKIDDVLDGFASGVKKALTPALIVILVYTCLVLVTYHPFQLTIYKAILGTSKKYNVFKAILTFGLAGVFNGDISYVAQSVIPYYTSIVTNTDKYPLIGVIFQSIYGLVTLFAPTSLILMGTLSFLNVSYKDWLKNIWKLLLELFVVLLIVFIILA